MNLLYAKVQDNQLIFSNQKEAQQTLSQFEGKNVIIKIEKEKGVRSLKQNDAIHLGFQFIADSLNNSGKDMRKVLKPTVDIPWSVKTVKEYLYKPILEAYTAKKSTTEMDKNEPGQVWDIMFKFLGEKHGIEYIEFPHKEEEPNQVTYPENTGEVKF